MATRAWTGAMSILVQYFLKDEFSSEGEMNEFMDEVQSDYENPQYHLYMCCVLYLTIHVLI